MTSDITALLRRGSYSRESAAILFGPDAEAFPVCIECADIFVPRRYAPRKFCGDACRDRYRAAAKEAARRRWYPVRGRLLRRKRDDRHREFMAQRRALYARMGWAMPSLRKMKREMQLPGGGRNFYDTEAA